MELFISVLNMSIAAAILFGFVVLLRRLMGKVDTGGFLYLLWIPFLFRLLIPFSLPSKASLYNLFGKNLATPGGALISVEYIESYQPALQTLPQGENSGFGQLLEILALVWYAGALILGLAALGKYFLLRKRLAHARSADLTPFEPLFAGILKEKRVPVVYSARVASPMVFGCLHPKVVLPAALEERGRGVEYILAHELTHIRRKDHLILLLFTGAAVLHWFNPLVWIAQKMMVQDIESACDQGVLETLDASRRLDYAQTLLDWADPRRHLLSNPGFSRDNTSHRIMGVLNWKALPRWGKIFLGGTICLVFATTMTNPVVKADSYIPVSSVFVSETQKDAFRQAASGLVQALETGDPEQLAWLASMDPEYYTPVYEPFRQAELVVEDVDLYFNNNRSAEVYLTVIVEEGSAVYTPGRGTLVARLTQTEYREEPFVSCLMPRDKYEGIRLLEGTNEAVNLAVRLARNLEQTDFGEGELLPVTVARVCMETAMEDKGETPPFSRDRMTRLAKEYFGTENFFCDDPAVYDSVSQAYFYTNNGEEPFYPLEQKEENGQTWVWVESYRDPMAAFPLAQLQCSLTRADG